MQINDSPTTTQLAALIERMNRMAEDVREIRASQSKVEQVVLIMTGVQKDVEHLDEKVMHLFKVSEARGDQVARMDKRLTSLERWHRIMGSAVLTAAGLIGWGVQRIEHLYQMDTRIQLIEQRLKQFHEFERKQAEQTEYR
ncbi:hypothetical protein ACMHYO_16235 [Allopusillimonas ginsengisoli]|uniref:hypothetical protein n=1 Tax=Allopusillimonas ginsengisoli TaxID=453575 RepID=UPI0039C2101E